MTSEDLKRRTKKFVIESLELAGKIPKTKAGSVIEYQLIRSAASVGANYRSACRSRTDADFASRITICEEESDECCYWLELLVESKMMTNEDVKTLWKEANELTAIFASSAITVRNKINQAKQRIKSIINQES